MPKRNPKDTLKAYTVLASPQGLEMMRDLMDTYVLCETFAKGDPHGTAFKAGQASVVLRMRTMMAAEAQNALATDIEEDMMSGIISAPGAVIYEKE